MRLIDSTRMQVRWHDEATHRTFTREVIVPTEQKIFSRATLNRIRKVCETIHLIAYTCRSGMLNQREATLAGRIPEFEWNVPDKLFKEDH